MEHFDVTSIPQLFIIPSGNFTMSNGDINGHTNHVENGEMTGSSAVYSSVSATTSETKRMGKFKFLTIPSASDTPSSQPLSSETVSSSSPHHFMEPTSSDTIDEAYSPSKFSRRGSATSTDHISSRHSPAPSDLHSESSQPRPERSSPRKQTTDDDLINKHVERLLKVTDLRDQIPDTEEDYEEEDNDFESRLDQMIAEEDQNKKKPRRRATSRGSAVGRRRSTRNSGKSDDKPSSPAKTAAPAVTEETTMSQSAEPPLLVSSIPLPEKPLRGRKKKILTDQPISLPNNGTDPDSLAKDRLLSNDTTSDDANSQTSELKDHEDVSDQNRPRKLKNRWAEKATVAEPQLNEEPSSGKDSGKGLQDITETETNKPEENMTPTPYEVIPECIRLAKHKMKEDREARKMRCECTFTAEEAKMGMKGCTEGCLNRMLYIECGPKCAAKDYCSNKRFQKEEYSNIEVFNAGSSKGHGIRAKTSLTTGQFICEYVGEILDQRQFKKRQKEYDKINLQHHYSMALNNEEVIDATRKGNMMRFTNHSCDPNAETQKWTVNGQMRIGFFTLRPIQAGEEITIDYQFERYGKKAQRCYCGSMSCRGFIGSVSDDKKKVARGEISDRKMVSEIDKFVQSGSIRTEDQALRMARLLLRVEEDNDRLTLLNVIQNSENYHEALRAFLRCQGLTILAALMFSCQDSRSEIKIELLNTLAMLPILSKNALDTSRVLFKVREWAGRAIETEGASAAVATALAQAVVEKADSTPAVTVTGPDEPIIKEEKMDADLSPSPLAPAVPVESAVSPLDHSSQDEVKVKEEATDSSQKVLPKEEPEEEPSSDRLAPVVSNVEHSSEVRQKASELLDSWDSLKMVFKIPRKINLDPEPSSSQSKVSPRPSPSIWGDNGHAIAVLGTPTSWPARPYQNLLPPGSQDYSYRKRPNYTQNYRRYDLPSKKFMTHLPDFSQLTPTWDSLGKVDEPVTTGIEDLSNAVDYNVVLAEQIRQNNEQAAEMVSQKLLDGSVAVSQKANIVLLDGSSHDVRTFQPTEEQVQQIIKAIPVIGSNEWTEKYATVLHYTEGRKVNVDPIDAPKIQNFAGWTSNFDLSKHLFLPKDWGAAYDRAGRLYFYNISNGVSRWDFPVEDKEYSTVIQQLPPALAIPADITRYSKVLVDAMKVTPWSPQGDDELDDKTTPTKRSASTTPKPSKPDPSKMSQNKEQNRELMKKKKIDFQNDVCQFVLHFLNSYRAPECPQGRIESKEDFKYLARKFTHNVVEQEVQRHRNTPDALVFSSSRHKPKIKEHIKKYMSRFGRTYKGPPMVNGNSKGLTTVDTPDQNGDDAHHDEEMLVTEKGFGQSETQDVNRPSPQEEEERLSQVKQNGFGRTPNEEMDASALTVPPSSGSTKHFATEREEEMEGQNNAVD